MHYPAWLQVVISSTLDGVLLDEVYCFLGNLKWQGGAKRVCSVKRIQAQVDTVPLLRVGLRICSNLENVKFDLNLIY